MDVNSEKLVLRFFLENVALLLQMGGGKPVFWERSKARPPAGPGQAWGVHGGRFAAAIY